MSKKRSPMKYMTNSRMNAYVKSFLVVAATSAAGGFFTAKTVKSPWYDCIKPSITPPDFVFPIVWTTLYTLLFFVLAIAFKKGCCVELLLASLFLNVVWCWLYFGQQQIAPAFLSILGMIGVTALAEMQFLRKKETLAATLLAPYLLWICFASLLNYKSISKVEACSAASS